MGIKMRFVDFWPGFDAHESLFTKVVQQNFDKNVEIVNDTNEVVDLEFASVFCNTSISRQASLKILSQFSDKKLWEYLSISGRGFRPEYKTKARKRIWYTGENKRPPIDLFDATISFDEQSLVNRNVFLPFWMYRLDWFKSLNSVDLAVSPESLLRARDISLRNFRACSFSSMRESNREKVVKAVSAVMEVDRFGKAYGKPVVSKSDTCSDYGFQICTENDLYPNYVTEKLQEAWTSANVPIWSGLDRDGYFNKKAFIDVTLLNHEDITKRISFLTSDEAEYILNQPLLTSLPTLDALIELVGEML